MDLPTALRAGYAILDRASEALARALVDRDRGAAGVLQLRIKPKLSQSDMMDVARMARAVTRAAGAALIINDDVQLALAVEADGVHLGQEDLSLAAAKQARSAANQRLWIGISTHDLEQLQLAKAGGADYVGFGPVFATTTKDNPSPTVGLSGLAAAVAMARDQPVVAIGGITPQSVAQVASAGAAAACAISAICEAADPAMAQRAMSAPWQAASRRK